MLRRAKTLLFIPDILRFWLTGVKATDFTLASTSQCFNLTDRQWDRYLLQKLELPYNLFPDVIHCPKIIGMLDAQIQNEVCLMSVPVVTGVSHDTAAAFMTVPEEQESVILSSGTWSIIGVKLGRDKINVKIDPEYFGYEGNPDGTLRLIRNVPGMYLLERCIREWKQAEVDISYEMLLGEAKACMDDRLKIDPFDKIFVAPEYMTEAIVKHCSDRKTMIPRSRGQITYAILSGLAEAYHQTICKLSDLTGHSFNRIHIIGGGSKNNLLNELIAKKTGIGTQCGYAEASCVGNILSQQQILTKSNKQSKTL
jgi:sugar (pentulose or hexulose) kinase